MVSLLTQGKIQVISSIIINIYVFRPLITPGIIYEDLCRREPSRVRAVMDVCPRKGEARRVGGRWKERNVMALVEMLSDK